VDTAERLLVRHEIEARAIDYWHEVDINGGARAHEYFTADGVFTSSVKTHRGREAIRAFYAARTARGPRVSRHVISNFRVVAADRDHASTHWVLSLYAADGAPILPSKPPIMLADVVENLVREADGVWRYRSRTITAVFRDDTPTTG
jgi:SnoaL-like domain